jgi:hypothetical protein
MPFFDAAFDLFHGNRRLFVLGAPQAQYPEHPIEFVEGLPDHGHIVEPHGARIDGGVHGGHELEDCTERARSVEIVLHGGGEGLPG